MTERAYFSCERDCLHLEMAQRRNKVLVQWTEGSYKGETNRANVKHIVLDAQDIMVGAFIPAGLNSRKYQGEKSKTGWSGQRHKRRNKENAGEIMKKATEDVSEKKTLKKGLRAQAPR